MEELIPGGAEAVRREIVENVAATNGQTHTPGQSAPYSSLPLSIPPQSHQHSGRPSQSPSSPALSNLPSLSYMNATSVAPNAIHNNLKFLLVCVEGRSSKTLAELRHLDVSDEQDDEIFIRRILEQYEEARRNHHWTMSLLVPAWIRRWQVVNHFQQIWSRAPAGVAQTASRILESPPVSFMLKGWSELASVAEAGLGAPLHILHEADFVRVSTLFSTPCRATSLFVIRSMCTDTCTYSSSCFLTWQGKNPTPAISSPIVGHPYLLTRSPSIDIFISPGSTQRF